MAASVPERMRFAPERRVVDRKTVTQDGWMLVGTAPGREPAEPWPAQIEFVLDAERSNINPERIGAPPSTSTSRRRDSRLNRIALLPRAWPPTRHGARC
jgi:hypothetical protein